ncbi:MAG: MobP3 family relaxase [Oscillospiraceae bacterium]
MQGYLKYIATRPSAEKHGAHGLFGRQENTELTAAMHDLTAHDGNVWTIIYSLHREDAERLGYNSAAAWQKLLVRQQSKFAEAFHIPASALHWYAAYHDADTHPHIHMMIWTDQKTVLKRDAVVKLRSVMTNSIFQAELENLYIRKDAAYKDVSEAAREVMRELVDRMESVSAQPASVQQKLLELAMELRTTSGKKQYAYLKKPLKDMVDSIVDELEKLPEVAAYYSVWNGLRDTLEGYYKNRPRQHNPLSQQKEFRAIKNAIIQEAERLRQQMEQETSQAEEPSAEETSTDASTNPTLADENTSSAASHSAPLLSEYLLNSTIRLFHQMGQIFRDNAAPPSNPMGIRVDSKRRKKLMQKRLAMGHKQDDHEQEQGYNLDIR